MSPPEHPFSNRREHDIRYLVVVDGEHYPPVTASALELLRAQGHELVGGVLAGGREKLRAGNLESLAGVPIRAGTDAREVLLEALRELSPEAVFDLSDEPVLDYRKRFELISVSLHAGVAYRGADFAFDPPPRPRLASTPSLAIIGTGKRTGKTAIAGFAARTLTEGGRRPVIVAMGRGGPPEPEVLRGDEITLEPSNLLELADAGKHAASDYVEDALLGRVPTVGCRRCGGGLAGAVGVSNVAEGVGVANGLPGDIMLLEGSGAAIPPVHADATLLVVPADIPFEFLSGYLGPYRLLLSDLVVVTMCEDPFASPSRVFELTSQIRDAWRPTGRGARQGSEIQVVRTVFRPQPIRPIEGSDAFVATTAPEKAAGAIERHLEREHGCRVVGISHSLSNRERLEVELSEKAQSADILLCEIKASGVDVATRWAVDVGLEVVYLDNVPRGVGGDDMRAAISSVALLSDERFGT